MKVTMFDRIRKLTAIQLADPTESKYTILAHTNEELGEVSRAICIEDSSRLKRHKKLDEPANSEAIDLMICAMSLFYATGGVDEDIEVISRAKLDKWENTFTINQDTEDEK